MFTTVFIYLLCTLLIFWAYCGYFIMLYLLSLFGDTKTQSSEHEKVRSRVSVLVPCFNEEDFVKDKVENLKQIDYPAELIEVYFIDGSSTDKTVERIEHEIEGLKNMKVVKTDLRGKIHQLNSVIGGLDTDVIINTDMDTIMEKDVVLKLVRVFEKDSEVAVAGAHVIPRGGMEMEHQYWEDQNLVRFLESKIHSSSIVIAPCYAFRAALIKAFPADCIADDIYISFIANSKGQKSKYLEDALVYESRSPESLEELLKHKFRKGNAYITELLRFLYMLPVMESRWKVIYCTKFLQVILIPWIIPFFALSTISQVLTGVAAMKLPAFAISFLFISMLVTHALFKRGKKLIVTQRYKRRSFLAIFIITNFILLINALTFPFYRQTSSYSKINKEQ